MKQEWNIKVYFITFYKFSVTDNRETFSNYFKKIGFTDRQLNECFKILDLRKNIMFNKSNGKIKSSGDPSENYSMGYSKGLYQGAVDQTNHIINILLESKTNNIICNIHSLKEKTINLHELMTKIEFLYNVSSVLNFIFEDAEEEYDINLAFQFENVKTDHEEEYYIICQKDKGDKHIDYTLLTFDSFEYNYKPSNYEKKEMEKYLLKNNI